MPPRECDNDDCDYETYVDGNGNPQVRWVHFDGCDGPVKFQMPTEIPKGSFLEFLTGRS